LGIGDWPNPQSPFKNLIMKILHNKLFKLLEKKFNQQEKNQNLGIKNNLRISRSVLIGRVILKLSDNFANFEFILEKLEEYQFCLLFLDGKYFDFVQRIFRFNYISYNKRTNIGNEIINRDGFKLFGCLMLIKLIIEFYQIIKIAINSYKLEKDKLIKEISNLKSDETDENSKRLNIKLKQNLQSKQGDSGDEQNNCLLCLDLRKETSATPCGHLFCWSCIIKYLEVNSHCPFCRQECYPQNILQLQNLI
jgi:peroxin-10